MKVKIEIEIEAIRNIGSNINRIFDTIKENINPDEIIKFHPTVTILEEEK